MTFRLEIFIPLSLRVVTSIQLKTSPFTGCLIDEEVLHDAMQPLVGLPKFSPANFPQKRMALDGAVVASIHA
uniref:hypothetical protein n=1 Tax=Castellaniella defragrans TaxID=75697 RepID=UPI00333EABFC